MLEKVFVLRQTHKYSGSEWVEGLGTLLHP